MMTDWKTETFGNEHAAYAERVAADELAAVRERAEARMGGRCPICDGSGTVPLWTGAGFRVVQRCPFGCKYTQR